MRSLATRVLTGGGEPKKKVYPTNFVDEDAAEPRDTHETAWHVSNHGYDYEYDEMEMIEQLAPQGDADALGIQSFESDLEDVFQSTPDLQSALVSYQEARFKLAEKKRFRGFWPSHAKGLHQKGKSKGKKGFGNNGSKGSLLERIGRTQKGTLACRMS